MKAKYKYIGESVKIDVIRVDEYFLRRSIWANRSIIVIILLFSIFLSCSKDIGPITDKTYSGTCSFTFSGDFNEVYNGSAENTEIIKFEGGESLAINFIDSQERVFFIGIRGSKLKEQNYTMDDIGSEGYAGIQLSDNVYDTGAIGGNGTVNITALNSKVINGTVDMKLARPLNTADTVIVKGSFQLKSN